MFIPDPAQNRLNPHPTPSSSYPQRVVNAFATLCFRWTPRIVCAYYVGVYGLGYAYKEGIMFKIQFKAMQFFFPRVGYAGLGVIMPQIDWYASKGIFTICFLSGGLIYDICERIVLITVRYFFPEKIYPLPV